MPHLLLPFYGMMKCISNATHNQFMKALRFVEKHPVGLFQEKSTD